MYDFVIVTCNYLFVTGEIIEDDLQVLLSEKVARGIHQKWIDTLKVMQDPSQGFIYGNFTSRLGGGGGGGPLFN